MSTLTDIFVQSRAAWLWPANLADDINQYLRFRSRFSLDQAPVHGVFLHIAARSNYVAYVNGQMVGTGQLLDVPPTTTVDTIDISHACTAGNNMLAVLVHNHGVSNATYAKDTPGLIFAITDGSDRMIAASDESAVYQPCPAYRQQLPVRVTPQLHFTFEFDARHDDGWASADYNCNNNWTHIADADMAAPDMGRQFQRRPLPACELRGRITPDIVAQGYYRTDDTCQPDSPVAEHMQRAMLSSRTIEEMFGYEGPAPVRLDHDVIAAVPPASFDGVYIILDLGAESAGFFDIDLTAGEGTVIDIAWGEHLDDLRVRSFVGQRCFASRYMCRDGRQQFTHYPLMMAGRYLQLHISNCSKPVTIHYAGLIAREYPVVRRGSFAGVDALANRIHDVAVRTLELCMHDHYEDCPWREQGLYTNDARNQALAGYYCFGEYTFPRVSFNICGQSRGDDEILNLLAVGEMNLTIPSFSPAWVVELGEHYLFSADADFVASQLPAVKRVLGAFIERMQDGLVASPMGERYWHFYDWVEGLNGVRRDDCRNFANLDSTRFDAMLNLWMCQACDHAAILADTAGDTAYAVTCRDIANTLRTNIGSRFFDPVAGLYNSYIATDAPPERHELVQAMALLAGVVPDDRIDTLRSLLADDHNGLVTPTLSQATYKFEALLADKDRYGMWVLDTINRDWGMMLYNGATSFWETLRGGWDFGNAGSLCHGWSACPVMVYQGHVLGVRPLQPGFRTFIVDPIRHAPNPVQGVIPTPSGPIKIQWKRRDNGSLHIDLQHPDALTADLSRLHDDDTVQ